MRIETPHVAQMVKAEGLSPLRERGQGESPAVWVNHPLGEQEKANLELIERFWDAWKAVPVDIGALRDCLHPDITVRTGKRGEQVFQGREKTLARYAEEIERQIELGELTDFKFPVVVAAGPVVFHTWVWIAKSEQRDYHIERLMASSYLITDGLIERWDNYSTDPDTDYSGMKG